MSATGYAVRFDCLFQNWFEFAKINEKMAMSWDKRLNEKRPVVKPLGSLLWYLINRMAQEMELAKAIQQHLADPANKKRPLLCLVHGDECEYDPFLDWLKYIIPGMIRQPQSSLDLIQVRTGEVQKVSDLHSYMLLNLKKKLIAPEQVRTEKEIEKTLAENIALKNYPVIVHISLHTEDDSSLLGKKLIEDGFIKFWAQWQPSEQQNQLFLVFLLFKYQAEKKTFWQRLAKQSVNKKVEDTFDDLKELNFSEKFAVNGVVLPRLARIKQHDVIDWVEEYYEEHLKQYCDDKQELLSAIEDLYAQYPNGISMRKLAPKLKKIVLSFCNHNYKDWI